jgi:hypothetical protein
MKTYLLSLILLLSSLSLAWGQRGGERRERLEAMRVAYLTQQLNLSPEESQKFWPIYNEFKSKEQQYREGRRKNAKGLATMTDKEIEAYLDEQLSNEQALVNLKRDYIEKLKKVLPLRKIAMLPEAERSFKQELLQKAREMRQNR